MEDSRPPARTTTRMPCPHCHAPLPTGARKCAGCGEWIAGREPLVAADILFLTLLTIEIVALGVMAFHWIPSLRAMYAELGSTTTRSTFSSLVLGVWWCPAWMLLVAAGAAVAVAPPRRSRTRAWIFGAALLLGVGAGTLTWWGAMQPIFQMADSIKAE